MLSISTRYTTLLIIKLNCLIKLMFCFSNSINQPNQVGINKSQKQTISEQEPSKQTIKPSNITKQQFTSTNISSNMQHSTINYAHPKHHVSNNQYNNILLRDTKATVAHFQIIESIMNSSPSLKLHKVDW